MILKRATFIRLSVQYSSVMAEIILVKPQKAYRNLLKTGTVISFTPTAATLHVHVAVRHIEKEKLFFYVHFKTLNNSQIFKTVKKAGEILKEQGCPHLTI